MRKIKTDFYDDFQCIADKCSITCCQEWKIEVDPSTYEVWDKMKSSCDEEESLCNHVTRKEGYGIIQLNEKNKCPFLNEKKLCTLVMQYGDEVLSKTCTIFPREIHAFEDREEYSLVACCPEVVDILNKRKEVNFTEDLLSINDDLCQVRQLMIKVVQNTEISISETFMVNFYILLDLHERGDISSCSRMEYEKKEVQEHLAETISNMEFHALDTMEERNELLLDLAENYRKEKLYSEYLDDISEVAEDIAKSYEDDDMLESLHLFREQIKEYEHLFRNYLVCELFNSSLIPDSDFESMVMMVQWIALEYVVIQHAIFLDWLSKDRNDLNYQTVRDYIVIISRMTGYDQEDIREYLENSFQEPIWEWGYLALIIGTI